MIEDVVGAAVAVAIAGFVFYALAHTALIRPLIGVLERLLGREFFPFLDRIF